MGGATWSYQPPQSSQVMTIAVSDQYPAPPSHVVAVPIAFTTEATHDGPPVFAVLPAWSEFFPSGVTQLTFGNLQFMMSFSTSDAVRSTLAFHAEPVQFANFVSGTQMSQIELGAVQMLPPGFDPPGFTVIP